MTDQNSEAEQPHRSPVVSEVGPLSPHDRALLEAGKQLLIESVAVGREFCKFMMGASVSAIPVYLGLLKLVSPENYRPTANEALSVILPAALFFAAAILFIVGFFPRQDSFSVDIPDEIERQRRIVINHHKRWRVIGVIVYLIGIVCAVGITIIASILATPPAQFEQEQAVQLERERSAQLEREQTAQPDATADTGPLMPINP